MSRLTERRAEVAGRVIHTADGLPLARIPDDVANQLDYLWTRVRVHHESVPASVLLTSKLSGEGVTTVSLALAATASNNGRVLLLEADDTGTPLPVGPGRAGLTDVFAGRVGLDEVVLPTDLPGLNLLPVGADGSGDLGAVVDLALATGLLDALTASYDTVVVDAPALARSPLALVLAGACAASVLVVRHGVADIDQVQSARNELAGVNLLGLVLNGTKLATPGRLRRLLGGAE